MLPSGFRADGAPKRGRKCTVVFGELGNRHVVAKFVTRRSELWSWYLRREIAVYRALAGHPIPAPEFVVATSDTLVTSEVPGEPLAKLRRPNAELSPVLLEGLLSLSLEEVVLPLDEAPPAAVRRAMRARVLEDPTDPHWVLEGLARLGLDSVFSSALSAYPAVAKCHGDLLLRNVVAQGDRFAIVDWECAGVYPADWDRALLWTQLAAPGQVVVEARVLTSRERSRAFRSLCAFALARERAFLRVYRTPPEHPEMTRLSTRIDDLAAALRSEL
ncbi:MAG: phosphotransferase [Polyangiaceae bacterium]